MATKKTTKAVEPEITETVEETAAEAVTTTTEETTEAVEETIRAKVVRTYRDKNTGKIVAAGTVQDLTAERFAELSPRYVKRW